MWTSVLLISSAYAVDVEFSCAPDDSVVVGVPPVEVTCVLEAPTTGEWGETFWLLGDGSTATGDEIQHTYTAPGTYSVSVFLDDYVVPDGEVDQGTPSLRRDGLVHRLRCAQTSVHLH